MESRVTIEEAAALWIARRHSDEWTAADEEALAEWLNAAPGNRVAYLRLSAGWQEAGRLTVFAAQVPIGSVPTPAQMQDSPYFSGQRHVAEAALNSPRTSSGRTISRLISSHRSAAAFVACAFIVILAGVTWSVLSRGPEYRTEVGGLESVALSDGSKVILNTNSAIRLAVTEKERRIDLRRGEAYFEVARDPSRTFVIAAGKQRVVAVGTKFSVRRDDDALRVVVTEGKVRIEPVDADSADRLRTVEVAAGRIAKSAEQGILIQERSPSAVEQALSWRRGYLVFRESSLADAVADFNRYNTQQLVIEDPKLASLRIDGNFRATSVEVFVRLLETGFPVRAERRDERIILSSK